jgi:uncharacterized protein with von Willebrand factor type A (vWA) domain
MFPGLDFMLGYRQGEILSHLLLFARQLKEKGLKITPDEVVDAARSLAFIDLSFRQDFNSALKANFVSSPVDLAVFDALFEQFWSHIQKEESQESPLPNAEEQEDGETCGEEIPPRSQEVEYASDISRRVQDWSGGTKIGHGLQVFNERYARRMTARSSVVILISDGWDRGEAELLEAEMKRLKRRARRLIWLNPLLGTPEYQPLCLGMRTALPYIDYFLPANTLRGLRTLGDVLADLDKRVSV